MVTAAHNAVLTELFDTFVPRIRRAMIDMLKLDQEHRHRHDQAAHEAIADAIRAKRPRPGRGPFPRTPQRRTQRGELIPMPFVE